MEMLDKKKRDQLLYGNQKIITRIRNEVGTYFSKDSKVRNSMLATGCRINGEVINSVLSRRVSVSENAKLINSVVMANVVLEKGCTVENAIIDKNVVIKKNVTIKGTSEKPLVIKKGAIITKDIIKK